MEPERAGHPVLAVQQLAEPFQRVRGHQQRPPGRRRHDGAQPHAHAVEGDQGLRPGQGGQAHRAGGAAAGRQHHRGRGAVAPPPAHHALVRGGRQQCGIEGVCAGNGAVGVGAGAAEATPVAQGGRCGPGSGEHGPLPCGGEGQGRVEPGGTLLAPEPEPASPSEDLAHERSFLSVERRVHMTPRVWDTACTSLRCAYVLIRFCGTGVPSVPSVSRAEPSGTDPSGTDLGWCRAAGSRGRPSRAPRACRPGPEPRHVGRGRDRH
ncbi:hypothetical protein SMICM304S_07373 [Streptomyces microflavus]